MSFHSSLRPHVTWDWVTVWAKLGIGVLLVINTTGSLTFNTPTMAFLLYTSSHGNPTPSNGRPGCPALTATKNGLNVSFSVNYKSGRTSDSANQELDQNPQLHQGAEFIIVALGGNDLSPGKIPSDDLKLPEKFAYRLWDLYTKLSKNANRVDVCTLIPRPTYDQFHQYMIDTTNSEIRQLFGSKGRRDNVLDLAEFFSNKRMQDMFCDGIHLTEQGFRIFKKAVTNRGLSHLKHIWIYLAQ